MTAFLWSCIRCWVGVFFISRGIGAVTNETNKDKFFENCDDFLNERAYGGPICGTDKVQYPNDKILECLNYNDRKYNVSIDYYGPCYEGDGICDGLNTKYEPVCGSDNKTYANRQALFCNNAVEKNNVHIQRDGECYVPDYCYREGIPISGTNPVCASNGFTYGNAAQVKCLQKLGFKIKILYDGGCTVDHVYRLYGIGGKTCGIARSRYEWNPVCATDGKTYANPFVFLCFRSDLRVIYSGECDTPTQLACVKAHKNDVFKDGAYTNHDYQVSDQVCGSDGRTYPSIDHVRCKLRYDRFLFSKHENSCDSYADDPCRSVIPGYSLPNLICGNDGVTYITPDALWCARQRKRSKLTVAYYGSCASQQ